MEVGKVRILRVTEFEIFPTFGQAKKLKKIEYQLEGFPPRFLFIPAEQYDVRTLKYRILQDLKNLIPDLKDIELEWHS